MGAAASRIDGTGSQFIKAVKAGQVDLVTELISAHPGLLKYKTMHRLSACHFAAVSNQVDVLQHLFSKAEEIEYLEYLQNRRKFETPIVEQLANAETDRGVTPLMLAVDKGCFETVKLLLEKGADAWAADKLGGHTALHYAARRDNVEILQLLIESARENGSVRFPNRHGTKYMDVRTQSGFTAVHFAVHANSQQVLAALLNMGAHMMLSSLFDSMDMINCCRGTTALHLAARSGNTAVAQQLLKAYADHWHHRRMPDPRLVMNGEEQLPCQLAARRQHEQLACMLMPSTPLASILQNIEGVLLGPPSLANIAAEALRESLHTELTSVQQLMERATVDEAPAGLQGEGQENADVIFTMDEHLKLQPDLGRSYSACYSLVLESRNNLHADCAGCSGASSSHNMNSAAHLMDLSVTSRCSSADSTVVCGVCFEQVPAVTFAPCKHQLCVDCCKHLLDLNSRCVLTCSFCRSSVAHIACATIC